MATLGDLVVNLGVNSKPFRKGLSSAHGSLSRFLSSVKSGIVTLAKFGAAGAAAIGGISVVAVRLAASAEQTEIAFETMLKSADKAQKLIGDVRKFTASTPFQEADILQSAKSLLAFGTNARSVVPELRRLGDISAGLGIPIGQLAELYGKARVQGRLFAEDVNQFTGRGVPLIGELAKQFGVAEGEVRKLVEDGKVGFKELQKAIVSLTSEGGLFFQLTSKQAQSFQGKISTLKDNVLAALRDIGKALLENLDLKGLTDEFTKFAQNFSRDFVPAINDVIRLAPDLVKVFGQIAKAAAKIDDALPTATLLLLAKLNKGFAIPTQRKEEVTDPAAARLARGAQKNRERFQQAADRAAEMIAERLAGPGPLKTKSRVRFGQEQPSGFDTAISLASARRQMRGLSALPSLKEAERAGRKLASRLIGEFVGGVPGQESHLAKFLKRFQPKPPTTNEREEQFRHQIGALEKGSAEAFEVLRANVGAPGKEQIEKQQLQEQKQQTKHLGKIAQALTQKGQWVDLRGLD